MHYQCQVMPYIGFKNFLVWHFYFELVFLRCYENVNVDRHSERISTSSAILNKLRPAEVCCKNHEALSPIRLLCVTSVLRRVTRRGNVSKFSCHISHQRKPFKH